LFYLLAANDISEYLTKTKELLEERDERGKPVTTLTTIVGGISKIKVVMQDLKAAEKELIKERIETEGRMKGQQQMGLFEAGMKFE